MTISRSLARTLRLVFRRALGVTARSRQPPVEFQADGGGLVIRALGDDAAVEYAQPGKYPRLSFTIPFEALKNCEGAKSDPVTFERQDENLVVVEWRDAGIPQLAQFEAESDESAFPPAPRRMQSNGPELLHALADAADTTDKEATRYALNCLRLRPDPSGRNAGQIAATDSGQLLVQSGFAFPWDEEVLIPANRVFACRELHGEGRIEIGKTDEWITIRAGHWTIHLRIVKEARFPRVEDHIPRVADAASTLRVSDTDAEFLIQVVNRLPAGKEANAPVTVDLNGRVVVRARAEDHSHPTELVLTGSRYEGQPGCFTTNREFLTRALALGFRHVHLYGEETPAYCRDDRRGYVWALLEKAGAIKSQPNMTRIESPAPSDPAASSDNPQRKPNPMPKPSTPINGHAPKGADPDDGTNTASLLEQAETLKGTLTEALAQTRDLISALKRQKKQTRLMQSTLQSLKALQSIDA